MDLRRLERRTDESTLGSMKPGKYDQKHGKYDQKHQVRITGAELRELKRLDMPESLGLDQRIQRFSGDASHPAWYRWELERLLEMLSLVVDGGDPFVSAKGRVRLTKLHDRLLAL